MKLSFHVLCLLLFVAGAVGCGNKSQDDVAEAGEAQPAAEASSASMTYQVLPQSSQITWEGYKPGTTHNGTVSIRSGQLSVSEGIVQSGNFTIDMTSITDNDLAPGKGKEKLEAHLKGTTEGKENDFFNVTQYPTGTFEVTKVVGLQNDPEANQMIYGNLTIKGISKQIAFRAKVEVSNGNLIASTPQFKINRTEWDLKFMSKNFFDNLGDNFIQDEFGLAIRLTATSQPG